MSCAPLPPDPLKNLRIRSANCVFPVEFWWCFSAPTACARTSTYLASRLVIPPYDKTLSQGAEVSLSSPTKRFLEDLRPFRVHELYTIQSLPVFARGKIGVENMVQRTKTQNNSLHLYLSQVAEALAREGHTMQDVVKAIRRAEIIPTGAALKEVVWRPLQEIILAKKSTTELTKQDIDPVYEAMNKWLGQEFQIHVPFPCVSDDIPNYGYVEPQKKIPTDDF